MVEWKSRVAALCDGTAAAGANEEITASEARLHLLIHVHVLPSPAGPTYMFGSRAEWIILMCPAKQCGLDLRHKQRKELPSYLFILAFLSITAIISITDSNSGKMKDAFPPIFNLEVATMAMMNVWIVHLLPLISPNLSWQLRYCLPGNLLHNNCYCEISPSF